MKCLSCPPCLTYSEHIIFQLTYCDNTAHNRTQKVKDGVTSDYSYSNNGDVAAKTEDKDPTVPSREQLVFLKHRSRLRRVLVCQLSCHTLKIKNWKGDWRG